MNKLSGNFIKTFSLIFYEQTSDMHKIKLTFCKSFHSLARSLVHWITGSLGLAHWLTGSFLPWLDMTCHWNSRFLDFWPLDIWISGPLILPVLHRVRWQCLFWPSPSTEWFIFFVWNRYNFNCRCFFSENLWFFQCSAVNS